MSSCTERSTLPLLDCAPTSCRKPFPLRRSIEAGLSRPLDVYRTEELAAMSRDIFDDRLLERKRAARAAEERRRGPAPSGGHSWSNCLGRLRP